MSSGECPDIYANWSGGPMNEYIEAGFAQPIDELFDNSTIKEKMQDAAIAQGMYRDKMYSVGVLNDSIAGIFYNKEMFREYPRLLDRAYNNRSLCSPPLHFC
mgnify:CR=1 FL=1